MNSEPNSGPSGKSKWSFLWKNDYITTRRNVKLQAIDVG